jgi:hypothetical protein
MMNDIVLKSFMSELEKNAIPLKLFTKALQKTPTYISKIWNKARLMGTSGPTGLEREILHLSGSTGNRTVSALNRIPSPAGKGSFTKKLVELPKNLVSGAVRNVDIMLKRPDVLARGELKSLLYKRNPKTNELVRRTFSLQKGKRWETAKNVGNIATKPLVGWGLAGAVGPYALQRRGGMSRGGAALDVAAFTASPGLYTAYQAAKMPFRAGKTKKTKMINNQPTLDYPLNERQFYSQQRLLNRQFNNFG